MNKQKLFKVLSALGVVFVIMIIISYAYTVQNRGEVIQQKVEVPAAFAKEFDRVLSRDRYVDMASATFMSPEKRRVNWQIFDGKYLLVNFWATWCAPCVLELPSLDRLQKKFDDTGLEVIAISVDTSLQHDDVTSFLEGRGIGRFAAYFDDVREVQKSTYMRGIPTSYLLDPKGRIMHVFEGDAAWDSPAAVSFFEEVLNIQ